MQVVQELFDIMCCGRVPLAIQAGRGYGILPAVRSDCAANLGLADLDQDLLGPTTGLTCQQGQDAVPGHFVRDGQASSVEQGWRQVHKTDEF